MTPQVVERVNFLLSEFKRISAEDARGRYAELEKIDKELYEIGVETISMTVSLRRMARRVLLTSTATCLSRLCMTGLSRLMTMHVMTDLPHHVRYLCAMAMASVL